LGFDHTTEGSWRYYFPRNDGETFEDSDDRSQGAAFVRAAFEKLTCLKKLNRALSETAAEPLIPKVPYTNLREVLMRPHEKN